MGLDPAPAEHEPDAVALGEFVLGYPDQTGETPTVSDTFKDGSFIVFRRLQQHVFDFRSQAETPVPEADPTLSPPQKAAKMIGRWPSGTPTAASPEEDPGDSGKTNAFDYENDQEGERTPRFAHIRKVNPRKEKVPDPENESVGRHRMIRRGIPFGEPLGKEATSDDDRERGLHFISVVADVARQFEFIQRRWANDPNFPNGGKPGTPGTAYEPPTTGEPADGPDPVIGERDPGAEDALHQVGKTHSFGLLKPVVSVTAGEYFFVPSIASLGGLASKED
jgi:Dyp-type peroxidase family